ncbi:hypothetical protein DFH07DRAFT_576966 [Mycena maculata]|uniref:Uncharacterized protein n=1 Tax=Mycena maculata TaxID=230809 RepID=A0AAD7IPD8_9AGAR|nr:hypothetical protein DFH07DRAFT_576966 [Mycena maculata]
MLGLKRILKWPRKRPREPGGPDSSIVKPRAQWRNRLRFKKTRIAARDVSTAHIERHSTSRLDATAMVAKTLVGVFDAPVISTFKPIVNLFDLFCQGAQAVRQNEEALAELKERAEQVDDVFRNKVDTPELDKICQTLYEIARYCDSVELTESKRRKLHLWFSANQAAEQIRTLRTRLDSAVNVFNLANNMSMSNELSQLKTQLSQFNHSESRFALAPSKLGIIIKVFQRNEVAFFYITALELLYEVVGERRLEDRDIPVALFLGDGAPVIVTVA